LNGFIVDKINKMMKDLHSLDQVHMRTFIKTLFANSLSTTPDHPFSEPRFVITTENKLHILLPEYTNKEYEDELYLPEPLNIEEGIPHISSSGISLFETIAEICSKEFQCEVIISIVRIQPQDTKTSTSSLIKILESIGSLKLSDSATLLKASNLLFAGPLRSTMISDSIVHIRVSLHGFPSNDGLHTKAVVYEESLAYPVSSYFRISEETTQGTVVNSYGATTITVRVTRSVC
jgi:hypothetical protein